MKKRIAILLILIMLLCIQLTACGEKSTVTIYIPATITGYAGEGSGSYSVRYEFEDGWQEKETFEVRCIRDGEAEGMATSMVYGDKSCTAMYSDGMFERMEAAYNHQGQVTEQTVYFRDNGEGYIAEKQTGISVYDDRGLLQSTKTRIYITDSVAPQESEMTYTYEETDEGYVGTGVNEVAGAKYVTTYNKEGRMLSQAIYYHEELGYCTEYTYDEHGNQIRVESYSDGVLVSRHETTYIAVEVSGETADRLPQFRRAE